MINNMVIMYGGKKFKDSEICCRALHSNGINGIVCILAEPTDAKSSKFGYSIADSIGNAAQVINTSILLPTLSVSTLLVDDNNLHTFTQAYFNYLDSNMEVQKLLCNLAIALFEGRSIIFYLDEQTDMFENQLFSYLANWGFTIYTVDQVLAGQAPVNIDKASAPKIAQKIAIVTGNDKYVNLFCTNQIPAPQPQVQQVTMQNIDPQVQQQMMYNQAPQPQAIPQQQNFNYAPQQQVYPNQNPAQQQYMQNIDPQVQQQMMMYNQAPQPQAMPQSNNATPPVERTPFTRYCQTTHEQREQLYQEILNQLGMNVRPNIVTPEQQMMMQNTAPDPQSDSDAAPF